MGVLLEQLGINWKLLVSQGVNFFILLTVLALLVYRPLLKTMEERKKKIELGLRGAEEVESRLKAIDTVGTAEKEGQKRIQSALHEADKKSALLIEEAKDIAERKRLEDLGKVTAQARMLVKDALIKTVELDPQAVDETLIDRAVKMVKQSI